MKKTNIRKLKQKELKSRKDSRLNKMLLRKRKQKKHKAERKLLKQNKINRSQMNKKGEVSRKRRMRFALWFSNKSWIHTIFRRRKVTANGLFTANT